jgi:hypothetical protein
MAAVEYKAHQKINAVQLKNHDCYKKDICATAFYFFTGIVVFV